MGECFFRVCIKQRHLLDCGSFPDIEEDCLNHCEISLSYTCSKLPLFQVTVSFVRLAVSSLMDCVVALVYRKRVGRIYVCVNVCVCFNRSFDIFLCFTTSFLFSGSKACVMLAPPSTLFTSKLPMTSNAASGKSAKLI